jgi:hypothetical protein
MEPWVNTLLNAGVLGLMVYLFLTGKLVSGETAKKQMQDLQEGLLNKFKESISNAVKDGFIEGWYQIHTSHKETITDTVEDAMKRFVIKEPKTGPIKR